MKRSLVLFSLLVAGTVLPAFGVDKEVIQIQQNVALLQGMLRELQRGFDEKTAVMITLIEKSTEQQNQVGGRMNQIVSDMTELQRSVAASVGTANQKVESLSGQMQGLQASLEEMRVRLDRLSQQLNRLESASQTLGAAAGSSATALAEPGAPSNLPAPDVLYNTALRDYTSGNYPLALQEFTDYLRYYSNTALASNAQFFIGDIYYQQGLFEKAIQEYDKAIEQYPTGNKTAAAQLKKGFALINMNLAAQGAQELQSLMQRFPNTPEAALAQDKLTTLETEPVVPPQRSPRTAR